MAYTTIFHLIRDITKRFDIRCVLIGGIALNCYGVGRHTFDVDFLITKDDFEKIIEPLGRGGYKQLATHEVFAKFRGGPDSMDIDFMFVDKETLDKVIKNGKEVSIVKEKFIVPSLNNLIALKLHAIKNNPSGRMYKDFLDVINLIKTNKIDFKNKEFQEMCLKYGTEEIYKKIQEAA